MSQKVFTPTSPADRPPKAKRTVLIAVDESDHSKYAFRWSIDNILKAEDWVVLIACAKGEKKWAEVSLDGGNAKLTDDEAALQSRMKNLLGTYASELSSKMISSRSLLLKGDAKLAIVGKAEELRADVIVMGSRGNGTIKKAVLGSVSDYCVHNASCPVLIVRKPAN